MTSRSNSKLRVALATVIATSGIVGDVLARNTALPEPASQAVWASPALVGAPILNNNQPVQTSGPTVTLLWSMPSIGVPLSYIVEASSTPSGPANLANFDTGSSQTSLTVTGVPAATYYVRVRARDASGASQPSNEVQLIVSAVTVGAPSLNNNQPVLASGPTVTLSWSAPATGVPLSYIVEASSTPGGAANLANFNTGNAQTTLVVPGVPAGTYYVRVRAMDANGAGAASNQVQLIVSTGGGGVCPSAPRDLAIASQSGGNVTLSWQPPATGTPTSYVLQAGSVPGSANLANFDTGSTALTLSASNVTAGSYFIRLYAKSPDCGAPAFISPSSNEILLTVGSAPGWAGEIVCRLAIVGPSAYHHDEVQTWFVGGPPQVVSSARTNYPVVWTAQGSGGGVGKSWTINAAARTDFSATVIASTGITGFDRTTTGIIIRAGIAGTPTSFDLYEIDFPPFSASSSTATNVTGTWSRPTSGGDSPQQPGGSSGTLSCTWSLSYR